MKTNTKQVHMFAEAMNGTVVEIKNPGNWLAAHINDLFNNPEILSDADLLDLQADFGDMLERVKAEQAKRKGGTK